MKLVRNFFKRAMSHSSSSTSAKSPLFAWKRWLSGLKIQQKIGFGYALALGVAILGTSAGILVANSYEGEAEEIREDAVEEIRYFAENIQNPRNIADKLIDINLYENIDVFFPLLKKERSQWIAQLAYDLSCSFTNNQIILTAVDRAAKIVFALKNYARYDRSNQKQLLQVTDGIETVLELYQSQLKHNIETSRDYQPVPNIYGYPDELIQVWTNLIHNAIQAMQGKGKLVISTRDRENGIVISFTDTGSGIPLELQEKIFEPFFTTKALGEGSGLGLHICQKIIEKHQGRITLESQPGRTQFSIWLPLGSA